MDLIDEDLEKKFTGEKNFLNILKTVEKLYVYLEAIALEPPGSKVASKKTSASLSRKKTSCWCIKFLMAR